MELAELTEAVQDHLAGLDRDAVVESDRLREALVLRERAEALVLVATAAWDRSERWRADGHLTAAAALRAEGMATTAASRTVAAARLVARNERLAKTLTARDLTAEHVFTISRSVIPERLGLFDEHADTLIDTATTLGVDDTAKLMRRWASHADDVLGRGQPDDIEGRRGLWAHPVGNAAEGRLVGQPDDLAALLAALDRLEPPDNKHTPGGPRTLAQRRYDALMLLARRGLGDANGRIDPAHAIHIDIDAITLAGGFNPNGRCEIAGFGSLLPSRVQLLLCGSWISRLVWDAETQTLDLGRSSRFFTPAQHQAITARDHGCAIAGCARPPHWCDAHHLDPWAPPADGETNLDNGISLCRGHHTHVHNGWTLHPNPDGTWHLQPP